MCELLKITDLLIIITITANVPLSFAQPDEEFICYGPASIAITVIITIILTLLLLYVSFIIWKRWKNKKEKHLVLETDPEKGKSTYAFDNDGFTENSVTAHDKSLDKSNKLDSTKFKWNHLFPLGAIITKNEKQKTVDDSALQANEIKMVMLKSYDFTGLGFNIYGNMRDGIFIKDILHRGPAFESRKLCLGDRIKSVTISFEHIVYEDALTILSYASPYEVILEAQSGKAITNYTPSKTVNLGHPLFKSSSATDLFKIQRSSKKQLFVSEDPTIVHSSSSSLQKSYSNTIITPENVKADLKHIHEQKLENSNPEYLKTQLEQVIVLNHQQQLRIKEDSMPSENITELQKTQNKYQKFGIKVLPAEFSNDQTSPKHNELTQNDNNINLELNSINEIDKSGPPPVKKREKSNKINEEKNEIDCNTLEVFVRNNSIGESGIKRDKNGIPQEIPDHMLNAAVAARKNRKTVDETNTDDIKSPKKQKGRAPAPPQQNSTDNKIEKFPNCEESSKQSLIYGSDSDGETDNQSSVNTIELNACDIMIHQTELNDEIQNRKTVSTGDLTKIQKNYQTNAGTLERAQSLDITDTGIAVLNKKHKAENTDGKPGSVESLYDKSFIHKEPRLSLALDGLNTFQRNRLKKSTEWGNLEDAVLNLEKKANSYDSINELAQVDAVVNKINEIKRETSVTDDNIQTQNFVWPIINSTEESQEINGIENENEAKLMNQYYKEASENFLLVERYATNSDLFYHPVKIDDTNISDDIKVSRHSVGNIEKSEEFNQDVSNIIINNKVNSSKPFEENEEFYITALDMTLVNDNGNNSTLTEDNCDAKNNVTVEYPTSLTVELSDKTGVNNINTEPSSSPSSINSEILPKSNYSLTYITEIQVLTPNENPQVELSAGEEVKSQTFKNYLRNFESNIENFETHMQTNQLKTEIIDPEKELHKIQEIAQEQLKKLPEMRFTTSSYESPKVPENCSSQIEQIRSNFEKNLTKIPLKETIVKSRIPVATAKTPPTSPERRDSRNFDLEIDKDIVAIMSSSFQSTPISNIKYQPKVINKNISVTSIRTSSKIPSGFSNRPPVPPRKYDSDSLSANGNTNNSFKQWVFNPDDNSITNVTVMENK